MHCDESHSLPPSASARLLEALRQRSRLTGTTGAPDDSGAAQKKRRPRLCNAPAGESCGRRRDLSPATVSAGVGRLAWRGFVLVRLRKRILKATRRELAGIAADAFDCRPPRPRCAPLWQQTLTPPARPPASQPSVILTVRLQHRKAPPPTGESCPLRNPLPRLRAHAPALSLTWGWSSMWPSGGLLATESTRCVRAATERSVRLCVCPSVRLSACARPTATTELAMENGRREQRAGQQQQQQQQ